MAHPKRCRNDPFRWFDSSPEVIRLMVMTYVKYPLSLRNVEDLLFERGIDICHETVRSLLGPLLGSICIQRRLWFKINVILVEFEPLRLRHPAGKSRNSRRLAGRRAVTGLGPASELGRSLHANHPARAR